MHTTDDIIAWHFSDSVIALQGIPYTLIREAADLIIQTLKSGGKIMLCGNGGSAADAQHIAAELMGRYKVDRNPLPAIALTTDTSALTAIANDYGYDYVFERQVVGLGWGGDCLVGISTSGKSESILFAMQRARNRDVSVIGLTGSTPDGMFTEACNVCIKVPSTDTPIIQQCHITIGHIICALVEAEFTK